MYKAKQDFLWYKFREEIKPEDEIHCLQWEKEGYVELAKPAKTETPKEIKKVVNKKVIKKKVSKK